VYKKGKYQIDISTLTSILEINQRERYAEVEALVTFEELCKTTLKHGLLPTVVPEFKSITIGGAIQSIGIESTSWIYGTFDKTVIDVTLITGCGTILSSSEAPDLWKAVPGSNGTLALIVAARVRFVAASEWIRWR
jgi:delta24-sterol reductase